MKTFKYKIPEVPYSEIHIKLPLFLSDLSTLIVTAILKLKQKSNKTQQSFNTAVF